MAVPVELAVVSLALVDKVILVMFVMFVLFVTTNTKVVHVHAVVQKCNEQIFR